MLYGDRLYYSLSKALELSKVAPEHFIVFFSLFVLEAPFGILFLALQLEVERVKTTLNKSAVII